MFKSTILLFFATLFGLLSPALLVAQSNDETVGRPEYDRIENLIILSEDNWYVNTDSSIYFAKQAIESLEVYPDSSLQAWAYISLSSGFFYQGKLDSAVVYGELGLNWYQAVGDAWDISDAHNNLGNILSDLGKIDRSLLHYYEAIRIFEASEWHGKDSHYIFNNIGTVFHDVEDYERAFNYFNRSLEMGRAFQDTGLIALSLCNLSSAYFSLDQYDSCRSVAERVVRIGQEYVDGITDVAFGLSMLADVAAEEGDIEKAIGLYNEAAAIYKETISLSDLASVDLGLVNCYFKLGEVERSLEMAKEILLRPEVAASIYYLSDTHELLSEIYAGLGRYQEAYTSSNEAHELIDSIRNDKRIAQIQYMELSLLQEKNSTLLDLNKYQKEQNAQANDRILFQRYLIIGIAIIALLGVILLIMVYRNYKNQKEARSQLIKLNREIQGSHIQIKKQNEELRNLNRSKDQILSIIGHDLRGPIGGLQSLMEMLDRGDLSLQEMKEISPAAIQNLTETRGLLEDLLDWGSHQLKDNVLNLEEVNVSNLVTEVFEKLQFAAQSKNNKLVNEVDFKVELKTDRNMLSFILRNLVQNSIKFSENGIIRVTGIIDGKVNISVTDQGRGMTEEQIEAIFSSTPSSEMGTQGEKGTGFGLQIIREFIDTLGGTIQIESSPGKGTSTKLFF